MNTTPNIHAMIVAAGRGSRFGAAIAKQYTKINGQTLLQHSVTRLASSGYIDHCYLVIAADDEVASTLTYTLPMNYVVGGAERWQSVRAGVSAILGSGADKSDLVLIHDAARPAVPTEDIDSVIIAAMSEPYGAILATPVADTLKLSTALPAKQLDDLNDHRTNGNDYIKTTVNRQHMWQAQTPQVFRVGELSHLLDYINEHQLHITDEASAFEYLELPIRLVTGSRQNIKLTFPDDAIVLAAILTAQVSSR